MAIDSERLETLHRLRWAERWSVRKIARHLRMARRTVHKYLHSPLSPRRRSRRSSQLDPYKETIADLLRQDPTASCVVLRQRLQPLGYRGGRSILSEYVRSQRQKLSAPRAFLRIEVEPGERFEVDWGHFGSLDYQGDKRKLYAFCLVECHSRRLYLEFTHSQNFETFLRCHQHAFHFMGGVARQAVYDNLLSAVLEHDGRIVRFNPRFLAFAREYDFYPRACHVGAAWEKGKVEKGGIGYVRQNFWPLRHFTDLADVNHQARQWLAEIANPRLHRETRQSPDQRFRPDCLRPLPVADPDYRDTALALVHTDLRLCFDANRYCVPPRYVGCRLTVKADSHSVGIYDQQTEVVSYSRSWRRGQTLGAERFEKELLALRPAAQASAAQQRLVALLGEPAQAYLRGLADSNRSLHRQVSERLALIRDYGPVAVLAAIEHARAAGAFGADYVANIVHQQRSPRAPQPPLQLKDPWLNQLATDPLSLLDYDALILNSSKEDS
jgi:transposase